MQIPPPEPASAKPVDEARLALLAAAERERVQKYTSSRRPRRLALIVMLGLFAALVIFAAVSAPTPPERAASSGDPRAITVSVASQIDTSAAPTGLSSREYVKATGPSAIVSAFASSSSLGVTASDVVFAGNNAKVEAATFQADLVLSEAGLSISFPSGASYCISFAEKAKEPSKSASGACS